MSLSINKNLLAFAITAIALVGCGTGESSSDNESDNTDLTTVTDTDTTVTDTDTDTDTDDDETDIEQPLEEYAYDELPLVGGVDADATVGFKVIDNKAITEGDIVLGDYDSLTKAGKVEALGYPLPLSDSPELDLTDPDSLEDTQKSAWGGHRKWTNGIVPYIISGNAGFSNYDISVIKQAMADIEAAANIKFVPAWSGSNHIEIFRDGGCWSRVGMDGGKQYLSLGNGCVYKGIVIHEFMHALGFYHEQSRADRDNYVNIHWGNIQSNQAYNFNKLGAVTTSLGPYDYGSIMHYEWYAFSWNGNATISSKKQGVSFGQRKGLSNLDIDALQKTYGVPKGTTTTVTNEAPRVKMKYSAIWMWNNSTFNMPVEFYDDNDTLDNVKFTYKLDRSDVIHSKYYNITKDTYNRNLFYIPLETLNPYISGKNYALVNMTFTFTDTGGASTTVNLPIYVYNKANWPGYSASAQGTLFKSKVDNSCLATTDETLSLAQCSDKTLGFEFGNKGLLTAKSNSELCLAAESLVEGAVLTLEKCDAENANQAFQYDGGQIVAQNAMHLAVSNQDGTPVLVLKATNKDSTGWTTK